MLVPVSMSPSRFPLGSLVRILPCASWQSFAGGLGLIRHFCPWICGAPGLQDPIWNTPLAVSSLCRPRHQSKDIASGRERCEAGHLSRLRVVLERPVSTLPTARS